LLQAVDECQSLNAAAKKLNMSYRAAWGRLKKTEKRLGIKLVRVETPGGAMCLTDEARELIDKFNTLERETGAFIESLGRQLGLPVLGEQEEFSDK
jgi:molybdate transport system regulatory protein